MGNCLKLEEELFRACEAGDLDRAQDLVRRLGTADVRDKDTGYSLVHVASLTGHQHLLEWLLQQNAPSDRADKEGCRPLFVAALSGHSQVVATLLQQGADVNARTQLGRNAFFAACWRGHLEIAQLLHRHAADIRVADVHGHSACDVALEWNQQKVVAWLQRPGRTGGGDCEHTQQVLSKRVVRQHLTEWQFVPERRRAVRSQSMRGGREQADRRSAAWRRERRTRNTHRSQIALNTLRRLLVLNDNKFQNYQFRSQNGRL
eukprot:g71280.t1